MKISFLKWTFLPAAVVLMLTLSSCDPFGIRSKGDIITMEFDESDFHGLDLCLPGKAEVRVGPEYKIEITAEETAMPYIETDVDNGILKVSFIRNIYDVEHLKVLVTAPSWNHFEISGSGDVLVPDTIEGQTLFMDISGSGSIDLSKAYFDKTDFHVSGSGDLYASGASDELKADISGSGQIHCFDFPVNIADLEVSGSGDMEVEVNESLKADISGSGSIEYEGTPSVDAHVSGSGKIKKH